MRTRLCSKFMFCGIVLLSLVSAGVSQIPVTISEDVETHFGSYHPIPVEFTPRVPQFQLEPDFSNVSNFRDFGWGFDATDTGLLRNNHFTVKQSQYKQLYEVYNACTWDGTPIFVTTDAVLHIYHVLFDYTLSEIEVHKFVTTLDQMTDALIASTESDLENLRSQRALDAAQRNLAYFYVAKKLLNGDGVVVPMTISHWVEEELKLIEAHEGYCFSPIFGHFSSLDYSQFNPRGHYTKSDTLRAYFKTMMWYGWTIFTMEPQLFEDLAARHSLQALMIVQDIYSLQGTEATLESLWDSIYEPTVFFVGRTDDPNIRDYRLIAEQVYGQDFLTLSGDSLANALLLDAFMRQAQALPEAKIPNWIYGSFITYKGFRFMGQRFIPDSYMMAHLVDPYVPRFFPKGLDVMAILGSQRASVLMDSVYHETSPDYIAKIEEMRAEFFALNPAEWAQNLYWNWLYCLMPLLYEKGAGFPLFMQTLAWADKELLTALAFWAELRHDTILYAKQSVTPCGIVPGPPRSYVEPNPELYARLASLARFTRDGLGARGLLLNDFEHKLDVFEDLLLFLTDISIKELENTPLTDTDYNNIFCFGAVMQDLVSITKDPNYPFNRDVDDMAVVADVHTDSNSDRCLEEGVGYPLEIYVIVNEGGDIRLTRGAIFSYYEFTQPIEDRLTDEKWREMLISEAPPKMPEWVSGFVNVNEQHSGFSEYSPDNLFNHLFLSVERMNTDVASTATRLLPNYPNPFNPLTTIHYQLDTTSFVRVEIYNINGQKVRTLVHEMQTPGVYAVRWDGRSESGRAVASGIYFCRMKTGDYAGANKLFLLR